MTQPPSIVESAVTRSALASDLARLGLAAADTVLVHASMRALGWVCGGATCVVQALLDTVGPAGTIIVPAQTTDNRDPSQWRHPTVAAELWPLLRDEMLPFDPALTPTPAMGAVAERVRTWPNASRSAHPHTSFAGIGARAEAILSRHDIDCQLGPASPLGALRRTGAKFLLLGVGYDRCTSFHLAEYQLASPSRRRFTCLVGGQAQRRWIEYEDIVLSDHDFSHLGADLEAAGLASVGTVGGATARLGSVATAVAFARRWFRRHRQAA